MFWNKKKDNIQSVVQVAEDVVEKYKSPIHTVDIINASKINYVKLLDKERTPEEEHLRKYLHTLKRREAEDSSGANFDVRFIDRAKDAGFNLFVKPDVVSQFKYAALVCNLSDFKDSRVVDGNKEVIYVGDIPDFALERIQKAKKATLETLFTIHSNQELPVKYQAFVYRDPVIILWNTNSRVSIEKQRGVWQCKCDSTTYPLDIGLVVAMWQDDGQPF